MLNRYGDAKGGQLAALDHDAPLYLRAFRPLACMGSPRLHGVTKIGRSLKRESAGDPGLSLHSFPIRIMVTGH
jgi:hypothetical protein